MQHASRAGDVSKIEQVITNLKGAVKDKKDIRQREGEKAVSHHNKVATLINNLQEILPEGEEATAPAAEDVQAWTDEDEQKIAFECAPATCRLRDPRLTRESNS